MRIEIYLDGINVDTFNLETPEVVMSNLSTTYASSLSMLPQRAVSLFNGQVNYITTADLAPTDVTMRARKEGDLIKIYPHAQERDLPRRFRDYKLLLENSHHININSFRTELRIVLIDDTGERREWIYSKS